MTDCLNLALQEAEDALAELGLGVSASVPLAGGRQLQFRKLGSDWCFAVLDALLDALYAIRAIPPRTSSVDPAK